MTSVLFVCPLVPVQRLSTVLLPAVSSIHSSPSITYDAMPLHFCPAYVSWRACNFPTGHCSPRTHPARFPLSQWYQISGTESKLWAPLVCSSCCVHWCRNISGVVLCSQHHMEQMEVAHECFLKFWHAIPLIITGEPGIFLFPLSSQFKALSMSPTGSCARALFPLWTGV